MLYDYYYQQQKKKKPLPLSPMAAMAVGSPQSILYHPGVTAAPKSGAPVAPPPPLFTMPQLVQDNSGGSGASLPGSDGGGTPAQPPSGPNHNAALPALPPGTTLNANDWDKWLASDPIYQQAYQLYNASKQQNAGAYLNTVEQNLLGYGSQELARSVLDQLSGPLSHQLGDIGEQAFLSKLPTQAQIESTIPHFTARQVENNPGVLTDQANYPKYTGQLAQLIYGNQQDTQNTIENLNKSNLFYSGAGILANQRQSYNNSMKIFNQEQAVKNALLGYANSYQQQRQGLEQGLLDALGGSRDRFVNWAALAGLQNQKEPPIIQPEPPHKGPPESQQGPIDPYYPIPGGPPSTAPPQAFFGGYTPPKKKKKLPIPLAPQANF